jgi:hypothetical protein
VLDFSHQAIIAAINERGSEVLRDRPIFETRKRRRADLMSKQPSRNHHQHSGKVMLILSFSLSLTLFLSPYREKIDEGTEQQMANQLWCSKCYMEK